MAAAVLRFGHLLVCRSQGRPCSVTALPRDPRCHRPVGAIDTCSIGLIGWLVGWVFASLNWWRRLMKEFFHTASIRSLYVLFRRELVMLLPTVADTKRSQSPD